MKFLALSAKELVEVKVNTQIRYQYNKNIVM
jgi:hypothetical protein